jgi:HSP20 family protein
MSNFFEKLKKGMATTEKPVLEKEEEAEDEIKKDEPSLSDETDAETEGVQEKVEEKEMKNEKETEEPVAKKVRKPRKTKKEVPEFKVETLPTESKTSLTIQTETTEKENSEEPEKKKGRRWLSFGEEEGQLTIDVYQTENDLVIQTAVAGVKPEDLDVSIERDVVTIRGGREKQYQEKGDYFIQECFWGTFSRQIILPAEVDPSQAKASFKEGVLTIRMPKIKREKKVKINISA